MFKTNIKHMSKNTHKHAAAQVAAAPAKVEKSAKPETMASFLDRMIAEGGEIEKIVERAKEEGASRGLRTKFNAGVIKGHIKFREKQAEKKAQKAEAVKTEA